MNAGTQTSPTGAADGGVAGGSPAGILRTPTDQARTRGIAHPSRSAWPREARRLQVFCAQRQKCESTTKRNIIRFTFYCSVYSCQRATPHGACAEGAHGSSATAFGGAGCGIHPVRKIQVVVLLETLGL